MGMQAPVSGNGDYKEREVPPPGNYLGVCVGAYMLGTQPGYQGGDPQLQCMLAFELHKRKGPIRDSEGRAMQASRIMNFSTNEKSTLVEYAGAMRGRPYPADEIKQMAKEGRGIDPEKLLGSSCRLSLIHETNAEGKVKDKIDSVAPLDPEDDTPPVAEADETYWDWTLNVECPKRIFWFWKRALENPDRNASTPKANPSAVAAMANDPDCPF